MYGSVEDEDKALRKYYESQLKGLGKGQLPCSNSPTRVRYCTLILSFIDLYISYVCHYVKIKFCPQICALQNSGAFVYYTR